MGNNATKTHNMDERRKDQEKCFDELFALDDEIEKAIATYVQPLRDSKKDVKKRIRDDFGISNKQLSLRYQVYYAERRARDAEDHQTLDAIRELFDNIPVGETVDFTNTQ